MKRLLITVSALSFLMADPPNIEGNWKLSGLAVDYLHITRHEAVVTLTDIYGFGASVDVQTIPKGVMFQRLTNGPFDLPTIDAVQLNLNVNLYPDGTGAIAEGSFYPDIDLIEGTCITTGQIFPVTDNFNYVVGAESSFPTTNILGIQGINGYAGGSGWGFGVNESSTFDSFLENAVPERLPEGLDYIALTDETVLSASCGATIVGSGACDPYLAYGEEAYGACVTEAVTACEMASNPAYGGSYEGSLAYNGAGWLHGSGNGGWMTVDAGPSQMADHELQPAVDFLLEWDGIDGPTTGSGYGDDPDNPNEDDYVLDDGSAFDRVFGLPYIPATYINGTNPLCDITGGTLTGTGPGLGAYPVAGDIVDALGGAEAVGALVTGSCLEGTAASVDAMCQAAGGPTEFVYGSCLEGVEDAVEGQCEEAGGPVAAVTGVCYEASQSDDFAGACAYYGASQALVLTCLQLGFDEETCSAAASQAAPAIDAYCVYVAGVDCATAGIDECAVLTNPDFALGLCGTLAGALTTSETCDEWAASFDDDFLNEQASAVLGASCTDYAAATTGLPWGAPEYCGAFAESSADEAFAVQTGMTCTQYGASYVDMCVVEVDFANDMYLMDPSLTQWGMFLTYNGLSVQQYQGAGYSMEQIASYFPELLVNDSTHDFDPTCYYTGETCSGRVVMNFAPTCISEIEARQIVAEFVNLDDLCEPNGDVNFVCGDINYDGQYAGCPCNNPIFIALGYADAVEGAPDCEIWDAASDPDSPYYDANNPYYDWSTTSCAVWDEDLQTGCYEGPVGDGVVNVVDVVVVVGGILGAGLGGYAACEADLNGDGVVNVVDVVMLVNSILNSREIQYDATGADVYLDGNHISIVSDGYIGGVDMIVEFSGSHLSLDISDQYISDYVINDDNTARLIVVSEKNITDLLDVISGEITAIREVTLVTSGMNGYVELDDVHIENSVGSPAAFNIGNAYPNPFNPSTNLSLELNTTADISVKVFNIMGQLVDVIADGTYSPNTYSWTWNAENLASGVYLVRTQVGDFVDNQKIMLLK